MVREAYTREYTTFKREAGSSPPRRSSRLIGKSLGREMAGAFRRRIGPGFQDRQTSSQRAGSKLLQCDSSGYASVSTVAIANAIRIVVPEGKVESCNASNTKAAGAPRTRPIDS